MIEVCYYGAGRTRIADSLSSTYMAAMFAFNLQGTHEKRSCCPFLWWRTIPQACVVENFYQPKEECPTNEVILCMLRKLDEHCQVPL